MVDTHETSAEVSQDQNTLIPIGVMAARNLALNLELPEEKIPAIADAIKDEINTISAYFSFSINDILKDCDDKIAKWRLWFYIAVPSAAVLGGVIGYVIGHR